MKNLEKAVHECMVEIYQNAKPKADWNELLKNAKVNSKGQKVIPYKKYKIEDKKLKEIVEKYVKKYKINKGRYQSAFYFAVYLGPSPVSIH